MFTLSTHIELPIAHRLPGAYSGLLLLETYFESVYEEESE